MPGTGPVNPLLLVISDSKVRQNKAVKSFVFILSPCTIFYRRLKLSEEVTHNMFYKALICPFTLGLSPPGTIPNFASISVSIIADESPLSANVRMPLKI